MKTNRNDEKGSKLGENNEDGKKFIEKKPFDKKKYRLQKYSNKYKVTQWDERRKKSVLRGFYKNLHKDQRGKSDKPLRSGAAECEPEENRKKKSAFFAAKREFKRKKAEKQRRKDLSLESKAEREEALSRYKEKKMQMYKKLSKKTKKGQPVMKDRLEMLLEKIKESTSAS